MLEKIKQVVFSKYKKEDCKGIFLSVFDDKNVLVMSNGVLYTDKVLDTIIDTLYHGLVEKCKNISYVIVDVVLEERELEDVSELSQISLKDNGIALIAGSKIGAVLPNTEGINDISNLLKLIKEKNGLEGNAKIVIFNTDRLLVR